MEKKKGLRLHCTFIPLRRRNRITIIIITSPQQHCHHHHYHHHYRQNINKKKREVNERKKAGAYRKIAKESHCRLQSQRNAMSRFKIYQRAA